jgi:hypothetical protein
MVGQTAEGGGRRIRIADKCGANPAIAVGRVVEERNTGCDQDAGCVD